MATIDWRPHGILYAVWIAALSGCGALTTPADVPKEAPFPAREDRLVLSIPDREPRGPGEPGELDREIAGLDAMGGKTADPTQLPEDQRHALSSTLAETFGTPAAPAIGADERVTEVAAALGLSSERLSEGGKLFRRHCLQCHGLSGDGRGPTGPWITPHPRDFRRGKFKFTTTGDGKKPRLADIQRTIQDGLKTTAMPPFAMLPTEQREQIATYVVYLSARGETEFEALRSMIAESEDGAADDIPEYVRNKAASILRQWSDANRTPVPQLQPPPESPDAVRRGYELFTAAGASSCISCHKDFGREEAYRYDIWGTVVRPANLTLAARKGGTRPEDLYLRIRQGISASGMPAHPALSDQQVWDLVQFLRALPQPGDLPENIRAKIYPIP